MEAEALPNTTTKTVVSWLDRFGSRFGFPQTITTDRASYFDSKEFAKYCKERGINHNLTTVYHHQGNGLVERAIQTLEKMIRTTVGERQEDWAQVIGNCVSAYNACCHHTTGVSPFSLMFNRNPRQRLDLKYRIKVPELDVEHNTSRAVVNTKKKQEMMKSTYEEVKKNSM